MMKPNSGTVLFLVISNTVGVYASLAFLLFYPVPSDNRELVSMMLGNVVGFLSGIVAYHFSSSRESSDKNHTIGVQAETARTAATLAASVSGAAPAVTIPAGEAITVAAGEKNEVPES